MPMKLPLYSLFRANKTAFGIWSTLPGTALARLVASTPGTSWVLIDAEHGQINDTHIYEHANAVFQQGASPLVRVPIGSDWWIKRALDSGAHGLMVPLVHDAATAREVVSSFKYAPNGTRGFGPMFTHHSFGCTPEEYKEGADDNILVIIQIESKKAVENVEEIAQVPGIDVLFVGPFDLSLSLGTPFGSTEHEAAIQKVLATAHKYGKKAGFYCLSGAQAKERAAQGWDFISVTTDIGTMSEALTAHLKDTTSQ